MMNEEMEFTTEEIEEMNEVEGFEADIEDDEAMPLSLEDFLCANPVQGETEKVIISERLKHYEFEIGEMDKKEYDNYIHQCTVKDNRGKILKQNISLFNELVVVNHCLYPDFKSVEFLQKVGVNTPNQALYKVLKLGEVEKLADSILKFNGFDRDFETLRKKAKN